MPEHTSFFTYLIAQFPALEHNMGIFGETFVGHRPVGAHAAEPLAASIGVICLVLFLALLVRPALVKGQAVIPDSRLTLRTLFEVWIGYWYGLMKDMMGPRRAKRYFPLVGSLSLFIVVGNCLGLIPGFSPPTSNWNITLGCAAVVFVAFNFYGLKANGLGYIKHLFGPWLGWAYIPVNILLFFVETLSVCIRPFTLSIRLMLNMAVDHLLLTLAAGAVALFLPLPVMVLGTLVCIVQVLVFCLLTSIYIALATEHDDHEADAHAGGGGGGHRAGAAAPAAGAHASGA
jgi:F-type H+-transporting ATPase subunit a